MRAAGTGPSTASGCASQPPALEADAQRPEALLVETGASPPPTRSARSRGTSARRGPRGAASRGGRRRRPRRARSARRASGPSCARPTSGALRGRSGGGRRSRARGAGRAARARAGRSGGTPRSPSGTRSRCCCQRALRSIACAPQQRQVLDGPEERVPLDELSRSPRADGRARPVVRSAEPAPEHEMLRRSDRRDRVELQEAEAPHGAEHVGRGAVEQLCAHCDAPRLLDRRPHARSTPLESEWCARAARRRVSSFASMSPRTRGSGVNRRTRSTPSARSAFRSARPTKRSPRGAAGRSSRMRARARACRPRSRA